MKTRIDGTEYEVGPGAGETALEVVRGCGHTAPKLVCGAGSCGACTILVDGEAVNACLLPAGRLEGAEVRTAAGLAAAEAPDGLHPVQRAFMACDGLQCGYCTPGFVVEAVALYEGREDGASPPEREDLATALAGHLCRCGAYPNILDAVARALAGDFDQLFDPPPPRVEARQKVTGSARYTPDHPFEGQLVGRILRSPHAHALVREIDLAPALEVAGVEAVVELLPEDRTVRFVGSPVAAVAAVDSQAARRGLAAIRVWWKERPAVFDLDAAQAAAAPEVWPKGSRGRAPNSSEGPVPPAAWTGNRREMRGQRLLSVNPRTVHRRIAAATEGRDGLVRVGGRFSTGSQIHTPLEPHAAAARWPAPDRLEVRVSTQSLDMVRREIAARWGLERTKVSVHAEHIGGGFGAKQGLSAEATAAIELSRAADGRPVGVVLDRLEELATGGHRPGTRIEVDLVADTTGALKAMRVEGVGDGGVSVNSTVALLARLIYPGVPKLLNDADVTTHLPPGKPFRAPFGVPFTFALESAVDEMAIRLGIDAIELRRGWDSNEKRAVLYDLAAAHPLWTDRGPVASERGRFRRGVGLAIGNWFSAFYAGTKVEVSSSPDGFVATTTTQDIGSGARSVIADAAANVLGVPRGRVRVAIGDTHDGLRGPASSGSRTTNAVHTATVKAAEALLDQLLDAARSEAGLRDPRPAAGGLDHADGFTGWDELLPRLSPRSARAKRGPNGWDDPLSHLPSGELAFNVTKGLTGAVHLCEVVVDTRLGIVDVRRFWAGLAAGRILLPVLARNQVHGAIVQGLGFALHEARRHDPNTGAILSRGFDEYRIPVPGDTPEIEIYFHEEGFEHIRGKAAGLSELATIPVSAAIANAVRDATGVRHFDLPMVPERIVAGGAR